MKKSYLDYIKECFTLNYFNFEGRARRAEYWSFALFSFVITVFFNILMLVNPDNMMLWSTILILFALAVFLPGLGVTVRRLHDVGRSGWWIFIGLVPIVGAILLLVWYLTDSQPYANQYGPNPKGIDVLS
ncbi:DUF805 domain-containing protein [Porphyromonas sp.]|uniref:DUF805 domain-containing protein n=1 Tax=Porphyromonas sp. TaxID=1924944 RepID=UPI0026DBD890|nr:DUF805 domain-containing protein [Porphyromonas sp.]MDO4771168.1 DUF805 domain-containing protein [Porphyromonas sp.]